MLFMQVPSDPAGYVLYARACLRFQQLRPAAVFAAKGLMVAEAQREEIARCVGVSCACAWACCQAAVAFFM